MWVAAIVYSVYSMLFPNYDSYEDCMFEWEFDIDYAKHECPGCNDWESDEWKKNEQEQKNSCLKFKQPWEF